MRIMIPPAYPSPAPRPSDLQEILPVQDMVDEVAAASIVEVEDLSLRQLGIGAGFLVLLALLVLAVAPFPKLFARPGEDRASIVPGDTNVLAVIQKANLGDGEAMVTLANWYNDRHNPYHDDALTINWLKKAAGTGNGAAMFALGNLAMTGQMGERDEKKAVEWFQKGAELDSPQCMLYLGIACRDGVGRAADRNLAIHWLQRAMQKGDESIRRGALEALSKIPPV